MNLEQQIKSIERDAPKYGVSSQVIKQGIYPALKQIINEYELRQLDYFIFRHRHHNSPLITTIASIDHSSKTKKVIYAFSSRQSALKFLQSSEGLIKPVSQPILHLLFFELWGIADLDSMIFMKETNLNEGIEVSKIILKHTIQESLKQLSSPFRIA